MKDLNLPREKGITILALTITIIILLILAGITIVGLTGKNGLIKNAGQAKEETEISNEKEILERATARSNGTRFKRKYKRRKITKQIKWRNRSGQNRSNRHRRRIRSSI